MKLFLVIFLFPSLAFAGCDLAIDDIKPQVRSALAKMHDMPNDSIARGDYLEARAVILDLISRSDACYDYVGKSERSNHDHTKWGEKSSKYFSYSLGLLSIDGQLSAASRSFLVFGFIRKPYFDVDMWEKVASDFYAREI